MYTKPKVEYIVVNLKQAHYHEMHIANKVGMTPSESNHPGLEREDIPEFRREAEFLGPATALTAPVGDAAGEPVVYACT